MVSSRGFRFTGEKDELFIYGLWFPSDRKGVLGKGKTEEWRVKADGTQTKVPPNWYFTTTRVSATHFLSSVESFLGILIYSRKILRNFIIKILQNVVNAF